MTERTVVGPKGQITIPKELREKYHLLQGEEVVLVAQKEGVLLKHGASIIRGMFSGKLDLEEVEAEVRELRSEWTLRGREKVPG
jgi:AbrB family looped-hinge helix DNA binding protein